MTKKPITLIFFFCYVQLCIANTPIINCPDDIATDAMAGTCGAVITYEVTSGGTCPGETITQSQGLPSGATFPVGTTTNIFVVTDDNGNSATCSFTVTVEDNENPVVVCVQDTTVVAPANTCEAQVFYAPPSFVSDNCSTNTVTLQHNESDAVTSSFTCDSMAVSSHLRVFDMDDFAVPSAVQVTSVEVGIGFAPNDPEITINLYLLEGDLVYENMSLLVSETVTLPDLFNEVYTIPTHAIIPYGAVVVAELVVPAFNDMTVPGYNEGQGQTAPSYIYVPSCGHTQPVNLATEGEPDLSLVLKVNTSNTIVEQTAGLESGAFFPVGTTTNTYQITDAAGNSAACSFDVTVRDEQAPLLVCPGNTDVMTDPDACGAVVDFEVTTVENCPDEQITILEGLPSGSFFPIGTTLNVLVVSDASGNLDTCRFDVTVRDGQAPQMICPDDIVVTAAEGNCFAGVAYNIAANDNCAVADIQQISGLPSGFEFPIGTTTNTFVAIDETGLRDTCHFLVTVLENTAPQIQCPSDITVSADAGACTATVNYTLPTLLGDCAVLDISLHQHLNDVVQSGFECFPQGSRHLRVFDLPAMGVAGALEVKSVDIGIGYAENNPELTLNLYLLDGELLYENMTLIASQTATIPNLFNDIYTFDLATSVQAGAILVVEAAVPFAADASFLVGYNEGAEFRPSYYANDTCFTSEPTLLQNFGTDLALVMTVHGQSLATSNINQMAGLPSGSAFPIGTTQNTFAVTDAQGNTESCSFMITVEDTEAPSLECADNVMVFTTAASCDTMLQVPMPTFVDNCMGEVTLTNDYTNTEDASAVYPAGVSIVTWTATDAVGNQSTCTTQVTVMSDGLQATLSKTDIPCAGGILNQGTANVEVTSGTPPYEYLWSTGETDTMITNLEPGIYTVTVTDATDCMFVGDVLIEVPELLLAPIDTIIHPTVGEANGSIELTTTGGVPPYTFLWNTGADTEDLFDVPAGEYELLVTDANDCVLLISFELEGVVSTTQIDPLLGFELYPNPATTQVFLDIRFSQKRDAILRITNALGVHILEMPIMDMYHFQKNIATQNWHSGVYFVQVWHNNQVLYTQKLIIAQ